MKVHKRRRLGKCVGLAIHGCPLPVLDHMPVPKLRRIYCWIGQAWVRCHPWSGGLAKPLDLRVRNECSLKVRECWADKNPIVFFIYCLFYNSESWMKRTSAAMTQVPIQVDKYLLRLWPVDRIEKSNFVVCSTLTRFRSSIFPQVVPSWLCQK